MKTRDRTCHDMLIRVRDLAVAYRQRFAQSSSAHSAMSIVATEVAEIEALLVAEHVSSRSARAARKAGARQQLVDVLVRAANTAWVLSRTIPELAGHADAPVRMGDRQLVTFGRGFLAAATPHATQFATHDIPIEGVRNEIEAFEAVLAENTMRRDELTQTRNRLKASLKRALEAVDTLDVTVANTFASDADVRATWKLARRLEKPRPRARAVKPVVTSAPAAPPAPPPVSPDTVAPPAAREAVRPETPIVTAQRQKPRDDWEADLSADVSNPRIFTGGGTNAILVTGPDCAGRASRRRAPSVHAVLRRIQARLHYWPDRRAASSESAHRAGDQRHGTRRSHRALGI